MECRSDSSDSVQMDSIDNDQRLDHENPTQKQVRLVEDVAETSTIVQSHLNDPEISKKMWSQKVFSLRVVFYVFLISAALTAIIFLVNGLIALFGFYNLYTSIKNTLDISSFDVANMETLSASISIRSSFTPGILAQTVGFDLRPSNFQIWIPNFVVKSLDNKSRLPLITVDIPEISFERGQRTIDLDDISVNINEEVPINEIIRWYQSHTNDKRQVIVKGSVEIFTWTFLFPISYNFQFERSLPLESTSSNYQNSAPFSIDGLEFVDNSSVHELKAEILLTVSEKVLPKYVSMELPAMQFGIQQHIDPSYPSEILKVSISLQVLC